MHDWQFIFEDDLDSVNQVASQLLRGINKFSQNRNYHKDGSILYCEWYNSTLVDESKNLISMLSIVQNVTDHKKADMGLEALSQRLALSLKSGNIGYWDWDIDQDILFWDDRMYELYGVTKKSDARLVYDIWANGMHPDDRKDIETLVQQVLLGQAEYDAEYRVIHPDRSIHFIKAYGTLLRDAQGVPKSMIGVNFDISDRKQAEFALIEAKEAAEAATKAKGAFLANMSHEIRTPMNGVLGMAQLLETTELDEEQADFVKTIKDSGDALLSIINDILDFSKIESGMLAIEEWEFDLEDVIGGVCQLLNSQAIAKQINLQYAIAPHVPANVIGDRHRLRQILLNLIGNAIKFTQSGGVTVSITSSSDPSSNKYILKFAIADTGIGIKGDRIDQLFQPFTQADASISRKYGGTGLGLAISKLLVELMGGTIWVESLGHIGGKPVLDWQSASTTEDSNQGSTFHFTIAVSASEIEQEAIASRQISSTKEIFIDPQLAEKFPLQILLVEDNQFNQLIATTFLAKLGYQIDLANNGLEALQAIQNHSYDLILMDMQMPEMDGLTATKLIRQSPENSHLRIVAMTANAMPEDRQACLDAGMNDYISKPINMQEIIRLVSSLK
jgi:PAS domain S-box-containing protein